MSQSDERLYATLAHAGIILFGFLPPLIIWLIGKDKSAYVDRQGKEALNFSILITIGYVVSSLLMVVLIGFVTWFAVLVISLVFCIQAAMAVNKGLDYQYPFNWRIIK
ncbi:DUF4870 domain-containing protein [Demequina zhanjiangensis]|uniref:DUF4870 domain-containing protein n=1 Tax=Demequina zhanjiangensis TaxID=3051659 RepID=A0ABT8G034_9MICO|nr:DUF4870 domain-containing protein [Demequina sp. SYSU T00b26]MDN4472493.1 DUF4870 domain-containing protein [Demequina sp. SYSU T00b26]